MSSKRAWVWSGRLAALVAAVVIPACGDNGSSGGQNPNGIFWNSVAGSSGGGTGAPGQSLWVDPNSGLGASTIGISNIITSADDATYDGYYPSGQGGLTAAKIVYIFNNLHPLSTDTGSQAITTRENQLQGQINGYRQQQLGNVGGGGVNGGIAVGNTQGIILAGHFKGTKSARAHCKHYALMHNNLPFPPGTNFEGDNMQTSTNGLTGNPVNPIGLLGRLGKIGVEAYQPPTFVVVNGAVVDGGSIAYMGVGYGEANAVFARMLIDVPGLIGLMGWTNFAVGHWRGGRQEAYLWNIIFLLNPIPAN